MKIYRTYLKMMQTPEMIEKFNAKPEYEHNDIWCNKDDALSYVEGVSHNDKCLHAELWELHTEEGFSIFKEDVCLFEYDVNGDYFWTK